MIEELEKEAIKLFEGPLLVVEKKKLKTVAFVLNSMSLRAVDSPSTRVSLSDIVALTMGGSDLISHGFTLTTNGDQTVFMGGETESEMRQWILAIGAACTAFCDTFGVFSHTVKVLMLQGTLEECTGGIIKREEIDQEWQYRKSGALISQDKLGRAYKWDGMDLIPTSGVGFGKGSFDGLVLRWFAPLGVPMGAEKKRKKKKRGHKKGAASMSGTPSPIVARREGGNSDETPQFEENASVTFLWVPVAQHYYLMHDGEVLSSDYRNWGISRHFLTKLQGIGHWLSEGSVPEHLPMMLQMMRFHRMGWPTKKKDEDSTNEAATTETADD